jgi:hypothetical protein
MKLYPWSSPELRQSLKIVRTDTYDDVPGAIVYADEDNGKCRVDVDGGMKDLDLGPNGLRLIRRT